MFADFGDDFRSERLAVGSLAVGLHMLYPAHPWGHRRNRRVAKTELQRESCQVACMFVEKPPKRFYPAVGFPSALNR
jgi:hypothetical protein